MRIYGKETFKWFQARLTQEEYSEIIEIIKYLNVTRRNFLLRYLGIAKKVMTQKPKEKRVKNKLYKGSRKL